MTNKQIQDEINTDTKEIEKFLKKKKAGKLIVVANDEAFESLNKIYPKKLANKDGLFIVSNSEYLELDKDTLENAKIIRPQFLDMNIIKKACI